MINHSWLAREKRLESLGNQIRGALNNFAAKAAETITDGQRENYQRGAEDAVDLVNNQQSKIFDRLPKSAAEKFAGFASDGSPLAEFFKKSLGDAAQTIENKLFSGVVLGWNPQKTAREMKAAANLPLARAATIARTEQMRAYREAARETYKANSKIVAGWVWHAQLSPRTCVLCWAMHGTFHSNDEPVATHPACRCVMLPNLGKQVFESGADEFKKLSAADQRQILGAAAFEKYREGEIELKDLVGEREDARFGKTRYRISLNRALSDKHIFPIKSLAESEELAKRLGIEEVDFSVDYFNRRANVADIVTSALNELVERFPHYGSPRGLVFIVTPPADSYRAWFNSRTEILAINLRHHIWNDPEYWMVEEGGRKIYSTTHPYHIVRHEYAHYVHNLINPAAMRKFTLLAEERSLIIAQVSRYAIENSSEMVAEVFAALVDGKKFSQEVMMIYNKYGGIIPE